MTTFGLVGSSYLSSLLQMGEKMKENVFTVSLSPLRYTCRGPNEFFKNEIPRSRDADSPVPQSSCSCRRSDSPRRCTASHWEGEQGPLCAKGNVAENQGVVIGVSRLYDFIFGREAAECNSNKRMKQRPGCLA